MSPCTVHAFVVAATTLVAAATAQKRFEELARDALGRWRDATRVLALADVDGDGDRDVFAAGDAIYPGRPVRLIRNLGGARFADLGTDVPAVACTTAALVPADVDGDGDIDLFVGNRDFVQNRLFLNDGTGRFTDATSRLPVERDDTRCAAFGDVDGDGDLDLVVANDLGPCLLHRNDGSGGFGAGSALPSPARTAPVDIACVDVDGDGDLDVALADSGGQDRLWINDGTGRFVDETTLRLPGTSRPTSAFAFGDLDGDGDRDFVSAHFGARNRVCLNDGSGVFADVTATRMPADVDPTVDLALADVDGDGDLDVVFANSGAPNRVLINDGSAGFALAAPGAIPANDDWTNAVVAADLDGDGDADVLFGNGSSVFSPTRDQLLINDGAGRFADATAGPWPLREGDTRGFAVGDVDGDSWPDVVVGVARGSNELLRNDGFGGLLHATAGRLPPCVDDTQDVLLVDVDGDGDLDLVCGNRGQSRLCLNDGTGRFSDVTATHFPVEADATMSLAAGDLDRDGDIDLVLGNAGATPIHAQRNRIWINDGSGRFRDATATALPDVRDYTFGVALGDVDRDGDLDIAVANWSVDVVPNPPQPNRLWLNNGGVFTAGVLPPDTLPSTAVAFADLDADGDHDLVFANHDAGTSLYLGDGRGGFVDASGQVPPLVVHARAVALGDVDGDGDADIVLGGHDRQNALLVNDGLGNFRDGTAALPIARDATLALELVDLDRDGDLDMLVGNRNQDDRLHANLTQHVDAPALPVLGGSYRFEYHAAGSATAFGAVAWLADRPAPVRLALPPFGSFGLDPARLVDLPAVLAPPGGTGSLTLTVPSSAGLVGAVLYAQAAVYPLGSPQLARLTNVLRDVVRR